MCAGAAGAYAYVLPIVKRYNSNYELAEVAHQQQQHC
jgi:hypothetical protein